MTRRVKFNLIMARFCMYGFLKNQQYFAPFFMLAMLEKGLSFFQFGLLIGFRELCINLFEIPSGAVADLYGRRRSMIFSFVCYCISFVIFALSSQLLHLFCAAFLFALGEAFRTGTHKAIIFDYLLTHHLEDKRLKVYGFTRSWSQLGSATSSVVAAALVFGTGNYSSIFWLCLIPYVLNIINFLGYPRDTVLSKNGRPNVKEVFSHVWDSLKEAWQNKEQRRLLLESCGFEGVFKVVKDYLQVAIQAAALSLPLLITLDNQNQRTAVLIGLVYFLIYVFSSISARQAHRIANWHGSDDKAALAVWAVVMVCYAVLAGALAWEITPVALAMFIVIYLSQNIWRPILVSRINKHSRPEQAATTLSIESQSKSLGAMIFAPLLGKAVDLWGLWPVGVLGFAVAAIFWTTGKIRNGNK